MRPFARDSIVFILLLASLTPAALAAGYSSAAPMSTSRYRHTTTLLSDGRLLVAGGETSGSYLASAEIYDSRTNIWSAAGSLALARSSHTATLLANGKVLVAGGSNPLVTGGITAAAELYDPAMNTWSSAGSMSTPRQFHCATLLPNGKVLVTGGASTVSTSPTFVGAELYDPVSNTWSFGGAMIVPRDNHTATLLPGGKVLVVGGQNASGSTNPTPVEIYNSASNSWTAGASLTFNRAQHSALLMANGNVLVAGGAELVNFSSLNSAEIYNPTQNTWSTVASMANTRALHSATLLTSGKVLVTGGENPQAMTSTELYDPTLNSWSNPGTLATARYGHTGTMLANGKTYIVGGFVSGGTLTATVEVYDNAVYAWAAFPSMSTPRYNHTMTLLPNGKVIIAGGTNGIGSGITNTCDLYDPVSNTFSAAANVNTQRTGHAATLLPGGKVLVSGGQPSGVSPNLTSAELYDFTANTWTLAGNMAVGRYLHTSTFLPTGQVLIAGGQGSAVLNSTELYDPLANLWTVGPPMANARYEFTATLLPSGKVLVAGGLGASTLNSVELYDPVANTWSAGPNLITARQNHAAVLLPSGKVMVAGGFNSNNLNSVELYDPVLNSWTAGASMSIAREFFTLTLLPTGRVLACGSNVTSEVYDPGTNAWTTTGAGIVSRQNHRTLVLPNGKVFVAGGLGSSITSTTEATDDGLQYQLAWRPVIATASSPFIFGNGLSLTGTQFTGLTEASSGMANNSASNLPIVKIRSLENDQTVVLTSDPANPWSSTTFKSLGIATPFPRGYSTATLYANGIASAAVILPVLASTTITASNATRVFSSSAQNVTLTATVTSVAAAVNDGTVTFQVMNGATLIGTAVTSVAVAGGNVGAAYALPAGTPPGTYAIVANYNGGSTFGPSSDSIHTVTISPASCVTAALNVTIPFTETPAQVVGLSATVSSAGGTVNEGAVTFQLMNGATLVGNATASNTVANGTASVQYALPDSTPAGTYTIVATFAGGTNYAVSTDNSHALNVSPAATTVVSTNASAVFNSAAQNVVLSAAVTSLGGTINEGIIAFQLKNGAANVGSLMASPQVFSGSASVSYVLPAGTLAGTYTLVATYASSTNFAGNVDNTHAVTVLPAGSTTMGANASTTYSTSDRFVLLSAAVSSTAGTVNEGTVTIQLQNGSTNIGNAVTSSTVSNGGASISYLLPGGTPVGSYTIVAAYGSGSNYSTSADSVHTLTVAQAATTVAVANAVIPYSESDQSVTLNATVTSSGGIVNEGTVTFQVMSGAVNQGTAVTSSTVSGGAASVSYVLPAGTVPAQYTIEATYGNAADFSGNSDVTHFVTVTPAATAITAASTSAVFNEASQMVTLNATISSQGGIINEGTVTFQLMDGASNLGDTVTSGTVSNGQAAADYTLPAGVPTGSYTIVVTYNPAADFASGSDNLHQLAITAAATTFAIDPAVSVFSAASQTVALSATVTSAAGAVNEGMVTFQLMNGTDDVGAAVTSDVLSNGTTTCTYTLPAGLAAGVYSIEITYDNAPDFAAGAGSAPNLTVMPAPTITVAANAMTPVNALAQNMTLSATVTSDGGVVNEGTVSFQILNGNVPVGSTVTSDTVVNGAASVTYVVPAGVPVGIYTLVATYGNGSNFAGSTDNAHTATVFGPVLGSSLTATPNPAGVGQTVTLNAVATDDFGDTLTYAWTFGDGLSGTGSMVTHAYAAAGSYMAEVTVSDGRGGTARQQATLVVRAPLFGTGNDSDGDGFSDSFELAAGSDPLDPNSTPFGSAAATQPSALIAKPPSIKLNFVKPNDEILLTGNVPVPANFSFSGQYVTVQVNDFVERITLNSKGHSASKGNSSIVISKPNKKGVSGFNFKINKANLAAYFADAGMISTAPPETMVHIPVAILFNNAAYESTFALLFTQKKGVSGSTKPAP